MDNQLLELENIGGFSIMPTTETLDKGTLARIPITQSEKMQLSGLLQQLPLATVAANSQNLYTVSFPEGLPNSLTKLKRGGFSTMLKDPITGEFVGSASLYEISKMQIALLGTFTTMSVVTGQYFLAEINKNLRVINQKLDRILEFLYGEKKAELLSEISFVRYAYQNFSSIMQHDQQRSATITSLQESKKIAMKDIEFYMNDLSLAVNTDVKPGKDLGDAAERAFQIYESINLSIQLYATSSLLEVCYSQNTEPAYISFIEEELASYIEKCDKRALADFSILKRRIDDFKIIVPIPGSMDKAALTKRIDDQIEVMHSEAVAEKHKEIRETLHALGKPTEYIVSGDGDLYYKQTAA